jgi:SigmaK-factor processing regulatory protein BofA.
MRAVWITMLSVSSLLLIWVVVRNRLSWHWLRSFSLHLVAAAGALYVMNYSGLFPGLYIPLNPVTLGAAVVLGVPGVALMAGIQWLIL